MLLNAGSNTNSHVVIGGGSKDWVEATFSALEMSLSQRRNLATAIVRTQLTALLLQIVGVIAGVLLALWLATLTAQVLEENHEMLAVFRGCGFPYQAWGDGTVIHVRLDIAGEGAEGQPFPSDDVQ